MFRSSRHRISWKSGLFVYHIISSIEPCLSPFCWCFNSSSVFWYLAQATPWHPPIHLAHLSESHSNSHRPLKLFFFSPSSQALDFENKNLYILKVEATNTHVDPRFLYLGPFKDSATVRIQVEDVDEPPVFSRPAYIMEVKEDVPINSVIGTITAADPDAAKNPVK